MQRTTLKAKRNLIQLRLLCAAMLPFVAQAQFTFTTNNGAGAGDTETIN
jgi:hypothetical protein